MTATVQNGWVGRLVAGQRARRLGTADDRNRDADADVQLSLRHPQLQRRSARRRQGWRARRRLIAARSHQGVRSGRGRSSGTAPIALARKRVAEILGLVQPCHVLLVELDVAGGHVLLEVRRECSCPGSAGCGRSGAAARRARSVKASRRASAPPRRRPDRRRAAGGRR